MKTDKKIEEITWCDATSNENAWGTLDDAISWADNENWQVVSIGWILKETKEYILLCSKKSMETEYTEAQYGSMFKIPTTWIRERRKLYAKHRKTGKKIS